MLSINMDDVYNVLNSIKLHLIGFVAVAVLAIIVMIAVKKLSKPVKSLVRGEALMAVFLALIIVANLICTGPMKSILDLTSATSYLSDETTAQATQLVSEIAEEGVVLAQNDGDILPLSSGAKLNVFGWASTNPCYGGTGSGALNDAYPTVGILQGLNDAGIETNKDLSQFYADYKAERPTIGMSTQDWTLPEPNVDLYTDELMNNAKTFSDTAMIVITRPGGEGADLPTDMAAVVDGSWIRRVAEWRGAPKGSGYYNGSYDDTLNAGNDWDAGDHFLQLDNREEDLVEMVCSNFDNVIVLYNGANAFEMNWVKDYPQIKGVLLCPGTGQSGFDGVGRVISGATNPSGRTVDTYPVNMKNTPWWNNFGDFKYTNTSEFNSDPSSFDSIGATPSFVNYVEGIYVGYKFYETAAVEGLIDYDQEVVYLFGYGLSYTSFTQEMGPVSEHDGAITFDVTVRNTGNVSGKDVVEVYFNPPYTNGGIEKASANLIDFEKTSLLEPGAEEKLTFSIPVENLAAYDDQAAGCYVLEQGDYIISINRDSHNILGTQTYTVSNAVTYDTNNKRSSDLVAATNQFDFARGEITYLSRADGFANYKQATAAPVSYEMSQKDKDTFYYYVNYLNAEATAMDEDPNAASVTTGASTDLKLMDLRGLDYDDPKWDELLNAMTLEDYNELISLGGYQTATVTSVGKIRTNDNDGPASINNNFTGVGSVGFPAATLIGSTWNKEMAYSWS